jgi:multicomponent Na+:H+ antiporter subunit G
MSLGPLLDLLGSLCLGLGGLLLVVASLGVLVLPDAMARQHAATKAGTLALLFVCAGAMLVARDSAWSLRLGLILVFLLATMPVGSHLLARAAAREAGLLDPEGDPGERS